jgi:hypothetical protein
MLIAAGVACVLLSEVCVGLYRSLEIIRRP